MCGVIRTSNSRPNSELVEPLQDSAIMPPSITLGTEPPKPNAPPPPPPPSDVACQIVNQQGPSSSEEIPTIDLASDDAELQKAIALSLQDHQPENTEFAGISAEERDVSKIIEDSIFDSTPRTTVDLLNPQERRRSPGTPVGLKNIGNSCWFNVVIQPLFYIPVFRDMIINYPKLMDDDLSSCGMKNNCKMVVATLQHLFSLLIASDKKYIDPTEAITLFQGNEMRKNTQQDVCEFIHKLLEKLEEEFKLILKKHGIEKESLETNFKESDFIKLFYGQSKKETEEEDGGSKLETFGLYPLTVKKYKDIHESILASMANGVSMELGVPIHQDTWFKTLPSVLIFSLSRYEFSKEKQRAEKVHNKFDFPEYLYMDRYMEVNKTLVNEKHKKIAKIKQELNTLYNSLEKYEKFGSGETKYPLADILKYALEFAERKSVIDESSGATAQSPSMMEVDNQETPENDIEMTESEEESSLKFKMNVELKEDSSLPECTDPQVVMSPNKKMRVLPPAPKTINPNELLVLQACIPRWKKEVEVQVNNLKKSIAELEQQLLQIFEEPHLQFIKYKLHAVVVHEGQASGGHYWVYIFDSHKNIWLKFNDIQVTTSSWQELLQESIGGQNNASAYCLMYIDERKYKLLFSNSKPIENLISELPIEFQEYVKQDNALFMRELQEWELKKEKQTVVLTNDTEVRAIPATAPNSPEILCVDEEETNLLVEINTMLSQELVKILQDENEVLKNKSRPNWICEIINKELLKLKNLCCTKNVPYGEPALLDLGIYLVKNKQVDIVLNFYAYEILSHVTQDKNSKIINQMHQEALKILKELKKQYGASMVALYQSWKKHYLLFLDCAWHFVYGFRKLQIGNYEYALLFLMQSLNNHKQLRETPPEGCAKTLDITVLSFCHRKCLHMVNGKLAETFLSAQCKDEARDIIAEVTKIVVPSLWIALNSDLKEDQKTGELVRQRWFQIHEEVPQDKAKITSQLLQLLTNDGYDIVKRTIRCPNLPSVCGLYKEYKDAVNMICNSYEKSDNHSSDL